MTDTTDPTNDPQAAEHRAKVDALLAGTTAPAPAQPAPVSRVPAAAGEIRVPPMTAIEGSAQIAEHGYDADTRHLFLRFHAKGRPGSLYRYGNFGDTDYQAFVDAESKGSHFGKNIKPHGDRYPCERVPEAPVE